MSDEREFTVHEEIIIDLLSQIRQKAKKEEISEEEAARQLQDSGMLKVSVETGISSKEDRQLTEQETLRRDFREEMKRKKIRRGSHEARELWIKYRHELGME